MAKWANLDVSGRRTEITGHVKWKIGHLATEQRVKVTTTTTTTSKITKLTGVCLVAGIFVDVLLWLGLGSVFVFGE